MVRSPEEPGRVPLDPSAGPIWERVYTVAPLVVIGTREGDGYDLAPKHLALPLGWNDRFGFVCTERHATYRNARRTGEFTVSWPRPDQVVRASLAASPRCEDDERGKAVVGILRTVPATEVDGVLLAGAYLHLECALDRIVGLDEDAGLVVGRILAASAAENALRPADPDDRALPLEPLLAFLSPDRWAEIRQSHAFPFPARFQRDVLPGIGSVPTSGG